MRVTLSLIAGLIALIAIFLVLAGRAVTPVLVHVERDALMGALPLVRSALLYTPTSTPLALRIQKIKKLSGFDVTLLNDSGTIGATTLADGTLTGTLNVGGRGETIFEMVSINQTSSFVISGPIFSQASEEGSAVFPAGTRLAISKPDDLVGAFFDELFTDALIMLVLGIILAIPAGLYIKRPAKMNLAPIAEAINALARKDFSYRLAGNVGDRKFATARIAFNQFMDDMARDKQSPKSKETGALPTTDIGEQYIRSRLIAGESERRAFQAALSSVTEGVLIVDRLGRIVVFNSAMQEISGYNSDVVLNKAFTDVIALTQRGGGAVTRLIPQILSSGVTEVFPEDTMLKRRDGTVVAVTVKTTPIKNDLRGGVTHVVVLVEERKPIAEKAPEPKLVSKELPAPPVAPSVRAAPSIPSVPPRRVADAAKHSDSEKLPMIPPSPIPQVKARPAEINPPHPPHPILGMGARPQDILEGGGIKKAEPPVAHAPAAPIIQKEMLPAPIATPPAPAIAVPPKIYFVPPPAGSSHHDSEKLPKIGKEELPAKIGAVLLPIEDRESKNLPAATPKIAAKPLDAGPPLNLPV